MDYSLKEDIIEYVFEKIKYLILPSENNNYKSRFLQSNVLLYCVVFLLVLKVVTTLIPINFPQNIFFADITKSALENFINQTRQSDGLEPLTENQKLDLAAELKAQNMVQYQYFDHTSPSGVSPWFWFTKAGYTYKYAGENLAVGFYDSQEVYNAWLNSPSHKANIVNPNYTEVGTAVLSGFGQNNSIVVVQEFGSQLPVKQTQLTSNNSKPVTVDSQPETSSAVKTNQPTPATNNNEKVLSQETESQTSIKPSASNGVNNLSSKLLNSILYNYNGLLQDIIYGVSLVVIGILITLIFFNFHIYSVKFAYKVGGVPPKAAQFNGVNFKKELVFRVVLIIVLLSVATLLNKEIIISLIPHQVII